MLDHLEKKEYQKAMDIAESIDWRRVKNASMLNTVSEIYEYNGEFKKGRDILFLAFDRAPGSRKIVYRLGTLALKIKDIREATDCYEEFVKLAPKDPNQYILKYKILRTQGAALSDQIAALEEFKKAEYIEKWAYELAKLYDEAGMTAECLEECDDLILWFSEGKYVYLAMELKMKYKPLTPLQQEKYDSRPGAVKKQPESVKQPESTLEEVDDENEYDEGSEEEVQESTVQRIDDAQVQEIPPEPVPMQEEFEIPEETAQADVVPEEVVPEAAVEETPMYREEEPEASVETPEEHTSAIKQVVTGATLEEALAQGVAVASGINIEEEAMKERENEILANGQMMIDDILQKWEAKQKDHEEAIAKQKAKDEERLQKEREQARIRQEEERKEVERKAAEAEARRKAEEEAARKAAEEEARRKAEEEAARKAAEEEARRKAEEEAARKAAEEEARRKAEEEAARKAAEEEARRKAEEAARRAAEEEARRKAEEEAARKAEEEAADEEESERNTQRIPDDIVRLMEEMESENEDSEDEIYEEEFEDGPGMDEDFIEGIEDELAGLDMTGSSFEEGDFDEADFEEEDLEGEDFDEADFEEEDLEGEDFDEADFEEEDLEGEDFDEADFEEEDLEGEDFDEADFEEEDLEGEDFDEADFEEEDLEGEDFDEADFEEEDLDEEELDEADFDEDDYDDDFEDIDDEETDFDEGDFEEDMDEEDFDEEEIEDDEELDFGEDLEGEDFDEADFEEEDLDEGDFDEADFEEEEIEDEDDTEELEIEEPSEEEIQARIKKSKGGVPFDTGFVVTGRYDLSATSEIGLKAGLTEEQKKLFSYFVPVRGMSEQIVEVLDNDRRAQREGTSKTGNLLVIGRKGSGKTVLAVDIVKAIQKQRNLKQGKVAIVTGESLNKKELTNIIQKLRGGAIIIEHAGKLNSRTVKELNYLMEKKTGELLFVLEDQRKPLERLMTANPEFKKKFSSKLELPVFINDELVTFGQTYAKENGYKLDEMGILALYSRIDVMQREDHAVSVAEVKEIMDEAIAHSQKANVKHLARRVFGKGTDDSDRIILKEEDFKI